MWFVPTFHMPQPPPSSTTTDSASSRKHTATLHLTRKDLDFPLGLGTAIVDVDIDMEWVPSTVSGGLDARAAKIASTSSNSIDSSGAGIGTKIGQAFAGGLGANAGVGLREAVEVGQATGV
jgi:phosphatidylinositol-3,4,5-trisphosphate 3-phosphatase/dual-specificity protein phosphatase PTEN